MTPPQLKPPVKIVSTPRLLFRPDPVLGWSLSPNHAVKVGFRADIVQRIDSQGWRHVPGSDAATGPRVAVYGCSFTYGTGLADTETFTSLAQAARPHVRILNRGIGGHGTVQNALQFRRDLAAQRVDAAIFAVISDHRFRNIAHPQRMRQYLSREWYDLGVEHVPVARMDSIGAVRITYVPIWQPVLRDADFQAFLPDDHMIDTASFAVLEMVRGMAGQARVPMAIVLLDQLDRAFNETVAGRFDRVFDISTPYDRDHTFLPQDLHPNVRANALFAERLLPVVDALTQGRGANG